MCVGDWSSDVCSSDLAAARSHSPSARKTTDNGPLTSLSTLKFLPTRLTKRWFTGWFRLATRFGTEWESISATLSRSTSGLSTKTAMAKAIGANGTRDTQAIHQGLGTMVACANGYAQTIKKGSHIKVMDIAHVEAHHSVSHCALRTINMTPKNR